MVALLALNDELVKVQEMFDDLIARRQISTLLHEWHFISYDLVYIFLTHGPAHAQPRARANTPSKDMVDFFSTPSVTQKQPSNPNIFFDTPTPSVAQPYQPYPVSSQPPAQKTYNPFLDTNSPPAPKPSTTSDFDEFDMLAKSRHPTAATNPTAPVALVRFLLYLYTMGI